MFQYSRKKNKKKTFQLVVKVAYHTSNFLENRMWHFVKFCCQSTKADHVNEISSCFFLRPIFSPNVLSDEIRRTNFIFILRHKCRV